MTFFLPPMTIFIMGAIIGAALALLLLAVIGMAHDNKKPINKQLDENLIRELWKDYIKEVKNDNDKTTGGSN